MNKYKGFVFRYSTPLRNYIVLDVVGVSYPIPVPFRYVSTKTDVHGVLVV